MLDFTPIFRAFAKYRILRLSREDPTSVQEGELNWLLKRASETDFGREHGFSTIRSVDEYQRRVPLRSYDDFWNSYWKDSFPRVVNKTWPGLYTAYCWTSGTTTGKRKYIPYTSELAASYNKAGTDLLVHHVANRPKSKVFGGKSFMLGGTTSAVEQSPGVFVSEVSGFSARKMPFWTKPFFFPPRDLTDISDWMERTEKIAAAVRGEDIRLLGGMPSWLLIFLEKFKSQFGGSDEGLITKLFPNLELFVHGGVNFDPYLKTYQNLTAGGHAEFREIYPASEAFIAVADRGYKEGLRLVLDAKIFYEFVPVEELGTPNPTRHWIKNVEKDVNYAIILNSCAGAWGYILGDTVRFVETNPPRILITGRTSYSLSAFGEHLIDEEIEKGVTEGANTISNSVLDFAVIGEVSPKSGELGYHLYFAEFSSEVADNLRLKEFRDALDKTLLSLNDDYADHRAPGCGVFEPGVIALRKGTFASWMKKRGKLGDQHKVARVLSRDLADDLKNFIEKEGLVTASILPLCS